MAKIISSIVNGVKTNYRYFKAGVRAEKQEYKKLQRIKNTPEAYRKPADVTYARSMNKTKGRQHTKY